MTKNPEQTTHPDLRVRVRDLEMKLEHILFLLHEYRQLRLCDRCDELAGIAPALREGFNKEGEEE